MRAWVAIAALLFTTGASGGWPEKPVRIIVPAPQGGALDAVARVLAERLSSTLAKTFAIDYSGGATGLAAAEAVARAPADGYTLLVTTSEFAMIAPHTLRKGDEVLRALRPLAELARTSLILVGNPSLPATSLRSLLDHARARPGMRFATYGEGSAAHIAGLMLNRQAGVDVRHAAFEGAPPAQAALMGGKVPLMFDAIPNAVPPVREGKLKAFAVTSPQRSEFLPAVPTFRELGYEEIVLTGWIGVFVADKVPGPALEAMRRELTGALASAMVRNRLRQLYFEAPEFSTPAQLEAALRSAGRRSAEIVKDYRIQR